MPVQPWSWSPSPFLCLSVQFYPLLSPSGSALILMLLIHLGLSFACNPFLPRLGSRYGTGSRKMARARNEAGQQAKCFWTQQAGYTHALTVVVTASARPVYTQARPSISVERGSWEGSPTPRWGSCSRRKLVLFKEFDKKSLSVQMSTWEWFHRTWLFMFSTGWPARCA